MSDEIRNKEVLRREFLKMGLKITGFFAGGTVLSVVSHCDKVFASSKAYREHYPYKPHYSMVIHLDRCIGCELCVKACTKTNDVPEYGYRTSVLERHVADAIGQKRGFVPMVCMQCNNAPCVRACTVKATYKDKKTGIVRMNYDKCLGCKVCMEVCPYNARYYNEEKRAIDKCDFCFDTRLSKGEKVPACVAACPTGTRTFGDLSDPEDKIFKIVHQLKQPVWVLLPEEGTKPNVFYTKGEMLWKG